MSIKRSSTGEMIIAPTYGFFEEDAHFQGFLLTASGVDVDTVLDHKITSEIFVDSGWYWSDNASPGDYAEFSIVDKDDVLGLFSTYGLTQGVDVLELSKYVETVYLNPHGDSGVHLNPPSVANVASGLYMRTKVHTTTNNVVHMGTTFLWFEV